MPRRLILALTLTFALAGDGAGQREMKGDRDLLQGTWAIAHMKGTPKAVIADYLARGKVTFRGDSMVIALGDEVVAEHTFQLLPAAEPRRILTTHSAGPYKGITWEGIYAIEGDTLKLLFAEPGKKLPAVWPAKGSALKKVVTLKRAG